MSIIYIILIITGILVAIILIAGLFIPKKYSVKREIIIK